MAVADSMEEFKELFLRNMVDLTGQVATLEEQVNALSQAVLSVEDEFEAFKTPDLVGQCTAYTQGTKLGLSR